MFQNFGGWHLLIILAVVLLLFGAAKLPALAKSMGQSARVFKGEIKAMKDDEATPTSEGTVKNTVAAPENTTSTTDSGAASGSDRTP